MIIVEGMDNTGKTTLIQRLIRDSKGRGYLRAIVSLGPNKPEHEQKDWARNQLYGPNIPMIYDRFLPICDIVYGGVLRGGSIWDIDSQYLKSLYSLKHPIIIYCRPPKDVILGFEDGRLQMEGVEDHGEELVDKYDSIMAILRNIGFEVIHYDYTQNSYDYLMYKIEKRLKRDYPTLIK